ncbi:MAG: hypothetical protein DIU75_002080 [Mycolicibacterium hassiacum]|uniref:hypothetical protein n=1 Tax=Mycolicibacterium hassiacum TaxID=46351 RepID=UPI0023F64EFD|nr:hypothetical protein [Mycolicibacterium hassiacum]
MIRALSVAAVVICLVVACSTTKEGSPVANAHPPQDVWQLAERAVELVPLDVAKLEGLLGTPLSPNPRNPNRFEGGARDLGPSLRVTSSVIGIVDGAWSFAAINIDPVPCATVDDVLRRYPDMELVSAPQGHSPGERFVWAATYEWGRLAFGLSERDQCVVTVSLEPAKR